jgi:uncharacterized small protein (DUF1192 family)
MANYGFSYVPERGFVAFLNDLEEGEWGEVSLAGLDTSPDAPLPESILSAPRRVVWKVRLTRGCNRVKRARQGSATRTPSDIDDEWDALQRQLKHILAFHLEHKEPAKRDAAGRLFKRLLSGKSGLSQTRLPLQEEVDFGEAQVKAARESPLSADVTLLGIGELIDDIAKKTKELRDSLGRAPGQVSGAARDRAEDLSSALTFATEAFNSVLSEIDWCVENVAGGQVIDELTRLREPLQNLLDRYPPTRNREEKEEA